MITYILLCWFVEIVHGYLILLFVSIYCSTKSKSFFKMGLEILPLLKMGAISYTVYLLHFPLLKLVFFMGVKYNYQVSEDHFRDYLIEVGYVSFVLLFCLAVNYYYEMPIKDVIRNIWEKIDRYLFEGKKIMENESIQKDLEKMKIHLI